MKINPEDMVTKKEFSVAMKRMVTKTEFEVAMKKMVTQKEFRTTMAEIRVTMVTRVEFDSAIADLKKTMATKDDQRRFMDLLDEIVTEVRASREERLFREPQLLRIDDKVYDHEKRIRVLEKS